MPRVESRKLYRVRQAAAYVVWIVTAEGMVFCMLANSGTAPGQAPWESSPYPLISRNFLVSSTGPR